MAEGHLAIIFSFEMDCNRQIEANERRKSKDHEGGGHDSPIYCHTLTIIDISSQLISYIYRRHIHSLHSPTNIIHQGSALLRVVQNMDFEHDHDEVRSTQFHLDK